MESYIPLVKAIIISTMFSWGISSVVVTDQYMLKESVYFEEQSSKEEKSYEIYDLGTNLIHRISDKQDYQWVIQSSITLPSRMLIPQKGFVNVQEIDTTIVKKKFQGLNCKKVTTEIKSSKIRAEIGYSTTRYFANIPWLDTILNSKEKKKFADFTNLDYSPYNYLFYEYNEYPGQSPEDQVLRIIEKTEVDTTFIHTLLNLPLKVN